MHNLHLQTWAYPMRQWEMAKSPMHLLERPLSSGLNDGLDYGTGAGAFCEGSNGPALLGHECGAGQHTCRQAGCGEW